MVREAVAGAAVNGTPAFVLEVNTFEDCVAYGGNFAPESRQSDARSFLAAVDKQY